MKPVIFAFLLAACGSSALPVAGQVWQRALQSGGLNLRNNTLTVSAADAAGNVMVAGEIAAPATAATTATFGNTVLATSADSALGFVAKLSPAGQWLWAVPVGKRLRVGSDRSVAVSGVALTPTGDVVATGVFGGTLRLGATVLVSAGDLDGYVARLNGATGQWQWAERFGGVRQELSNAVALAPNGDIVVAGRFLSLQLAFGALAPLVLTGGTGDSFVARLDGTTRQWQWAASATGNYGNVAAAVAVDGAGRTVVTGNFRSEVLTFGALPPLVHSPRPPSTSNGDMYVAQLSPTGQWLWAKGFGADGADAGHTVAVTAAGDVAVGGIVDGGVVIGSTTITRGGFVVKLSAAGQWQWGASITGGQYIRVHHVAFGAAGQVLVAGEFPTPFAFFKPNLMQLTQVGIGGGDGFVGELSAAGRWEWVAQVAGPAYEGTHAVLPQPAGRTLAVGVMSSDPTRFGAVARPLVRAAAAEQNIFVATLVPVSVGLAAVGAPEAAFSVFPNPARGTARVVLPAGSPAGHLALLDALGRVVQTYPTAAGALTAELRLHGVAPGAYVVRHGTRVQRLVVTY